MGAAARATLAAALVLGGVLVPTASAVPATSVWSVVPSPNRPARVGAALSAGLSGVACPTSASCVVVGSFADADYPPRPLAGFFRGTSWSIGPAPRPAGGTGVLVSVACYAPKHCFGVGQADGATLLERWDGTAWSIAQSPKISGATEHSLTGVACPTTSKCFAVGYAVRAGTKRPLVVRWDGKSWAVLPSANPPGGGRLSAVACATNINCVAVGATTATSPATLVEAWDGTAWKLLRSRNPAGAADSELTGVSCSFGRACLAVGFSIPKHSDTPAALTERSGGDTWSVVANPDQSATSGDRSALNGITCISETVCFAVGWHGPNPTPRVMRWNSKSWSVVAIADLNPFTDEQLTSISCTSSTACIAVGASFYGTLIEQWNGTTWTELPIGGTASHLDDVSCPGATTCFAVGGSSPSFPYFGDDAGLVEQWNGTTWKIVASPDRASPGGFVYLASVSCPSTTACFAVGAFGKRPNSRILIERWDGTRWTRVSGAEPSGIGAASLVSVSCPSLTSCVAVGGGDTPQGTVSFVERWNGTTWTAERFPFAPTEPDLRAISCNSASACTAVGTDEVSNGGVTTVARWDGNTWTIVPSPNESGAQFDILTDVSCVAADRCFAVGYTSSPAHSTGGPLIEEWDGTAWSIVPSPSAANGYVSQLNGVSCRTTADCDAVGVTFGQYSSALALHWDGATWTLVSPARPPGARASLFTGVFCGSDACTAVGASETATARKTLIERSP
jgi:hypothetical protein